MYPYSFKEEFCSVLCCDALLARRQYIHLRKYVHNHKYTVITMLGIREVRHIDHGDGFPRMVGSRKRSAQTLLLDRWISDGTRSVGSDIFPNIQLEFWRKKLLL